MFLEYPLEKLNLKEEQPIWGSVSPVAKKVTSIGVRYNFVYQTFYQGKINNKMKKKNLKLLAKFGNTEAVYIVRQKFELIYRI